MTFLIISQEFTCIRITETYIPPPPKTKKEDWFHGTLSREEAAAKLRAEVNRLESGSGLVDNTISPYDTGVYLARISDKNQQIKKHVISLLEQNNVKNFQIEEKTVMGHDFCLSDFFTNFLNSVLA